MAHQDQERAAPDGTRSRTGCLTCRIRKKKCDECRPICRACTARQLPCYGFAAAAPAWLTNRSWREVRDSDEAKQLRRQAETRYKTSRRQTSFEKQGASSATVDLDHFSLDNGNGAIQKPCASSFRSIGNAVSPTLILLAAGVNIWQLQPDSIWWDNKMRSLQSGPVFSYGEETRLLLLFLDVIHPITHTFYKLNKSCDRDWMLERLGASQALHYSALSISACFECSLTQAPSINELGLSPGVRRLQSQSIQNLRDDVEAFASMAFDPLEDFVMAGMKLFDAISLLETLEVFNILDGTWEMHHEASRRIFNHIEICALPSSADKPGSSSSAFGRVLLGFAFDDPRRRSLEFSILNFVWLDVLATSTFGELTYRPCAFDYVSLLDENMINTEAIMGCQGWVMAIIARVAKLEQQGELLRRQTHAADGLSLLSKRFAELEVQLDIGIRKLEHHPRSSDSTMVTVIWAHGAKVLCQALTARLILEQSKIDQTSVNMCLERLEALPTRLVMRTTWPFTIAGSMALTEPQHVRFRWIVGRTMQEAQPPGISWKGLIVMEESWRLRKATDERFIGWREAMDSLGVRVLLT